MLFILDKDSILVYRGLLVVYSSAGREHGFTDFGGRRRLLAVNQSTAVNGINGAPLWAAGGPDRDGYLPPTKYEERILGRASFPTFKTELANPHSERKSNGRSSIANMALFPVCCSRHWQGVEAMQLGAKQSQLTASTGTSGFPSIIDSRRPVLHSQHIPTFCNAERQHSSSTSMRELSSFTRGQHYDDCGYTA